MTIWNAPLNGSAGGAGGCFACNSTTSPKYSSFVCADKLLLQLNFGKFSTLFLGVRFGHITCDNNVSTSTTCGVTGQYVTAQGGTQQTIDIWKALSDGAWTSSTTISVEVCTDLATGFCYTGASHADSIIFQYATGITALTSFLFTSTAALGCPTTHVCTFTMFDDGTFTVV